ncbi:MAG: hypothetical protein WAW36_02040 [Methylovulum miyakonense]|uniref:hypothetical protein n=1 Tax=Methylovulum miyakonense TaxID=645578 RepID=UPI003BB54282
MIRESQGFFWCGGQVRAVNKASNAVRKPIQTNVGYDCCQRDNHQTGEAFFKEGRLN